MTDLVRHAGTGIAKAGGAQLMIATTDALPGYRVTQVLGLVRGNTVRTRNLGMDFLAGLRNLVGGEVNQYTKMLAESREQALDRMRAHAHKLGANAILGMRITTSTVMQGAAEILAYGTAVQVEPEA